jgi:hypothetical protein
MVLFAVLICLPVSYVFGAIIFLCPLTQRVPADFLFLLLTPRAAALPSGTLGFRKGAPGSYLVTRPNRHALTQARRAGPTRQTSRALPMRRGRIAGLPHATKVARVRHLLFILLMEGGPFLPPLPLCPPRSAAGHPSPPPPFSSFVRPPLGIYYTAPTGRKRNN